MSFDSGKYDQRVHEKLREVLCLLADAQKENKRLHKALKLARETVAEEVKHAINTYGDCSMTRCIRAELAEIDAALEGQGGEGCTN